MIPTEQRTKFQSLVGVKVVLHALDSCPVNPMWAYLEEITTGGLLFRAENGNLIFASTAMFVVPTEKEDDG